MSEPDHEEQAKLGGDHHHHGSQSPEDVDRVWYSYLTTGRVPKDLPMPWYRKVFLRHWVGKLPSEPRCRICYYPFEGIGGAIARMFFGIAPSRSNPYFCNQCEKMAETFHGGAEVEVTVLFADVRGSTTLAEEMKPAEFSHLIKRFYHTASRVLFDTNAMVEKLVGDAVTGYYTPGFSGDRHASVAIDAACRILSESSAESASIQTLPIGIGLHTGVAYVGAVTSDLGVSNISILGDTANIGARLAALAGPGEIYISQATAQSANYDTANLKPQHLTLKGRSQPVDAWVLTP